MWGGLARLSEIFEVGRFFLQLYLNKPDRIPYGVLRIRVFVTTVLSGGRVPPGPISFFKGLRSIPSPKRSSRHANDTQVLAPALLWVSSDGGTVLIEVMASSNGRRPLG